MADYVVFAENRATNLNDERWSVYVTRKNDYQLHLPEDASFGHPVPLLIWLGSDGLSANEGMELWRQKLGEQAAIVVIEPPFRQRQPDLSVGGCWYWPDNFSEDLGAMVNTAERTWSYVLNRFPIDPDRVCLAGEGTGATVTAAVTLLTDRMNLRSVAIEPRQYSKIKDFSLPLLEDWGDQKPPRRALQMIGSPSEAAWWEDELQQYQSVGLSTIWAPQAADPWGRELQVESAIRDCLGLGAASDRANAKRKFILVGDDSPLHLQWARLAAQRATTENSFCVALTTDPASSQAEQVEFEITPAAIANGAAPLCPGPFGGTTVLVVPAGTTQAELQAWLDLEKNDPLTKRSRFHRLRIATVDEGEYSLNQVLAALHAQNRNNVLIVPIDFYAGEETMRRLKQQVGDLGDQMAVQWLPGLGGQELPIGK